MKKYRGKPFEISADSGGQAQKIEQINKAITEMNKAVQQTAASAEQMNGHVKELVVMVGNTKNSNERKQLSVHTDAAD